MYYECHVTMPTTVNQEDVKLVGDLANFKYSVIMNDEVFGLGPKCYLTKSLNDFEKLKAQMQNLTDQLDFVGIKWIRRKIESVILDERT